MTAIEIFLLGIVGIAGLAIFWSSLRIGITPMPSSRKVCQLLLKNVEVAKGVTVVDLGSGWGNLVVYFAGKYPNNPVVGYELSLVPFLVSRFFKIVFRLKNLTLERRDFMQADFKDNVVFVCYLWPEEMQQLEKKLRDLRYKQGWLVSNTFALPGLKSSQTLRIDDLYATPIYFYDLSVSDAQEVR